MQKTISFTHKDEKYISKPFDFKALCLVNEKHVQNFQSAAMLCSDALDYLFEGTDADNSVLEAIPPAKRLELCREVWDLYIDALSETGKNDEEPEEGR